MDAEGWDRRYADSDRVFSSEPNELLVELASPLRPGRALDLAAGAGRNSLWLARRGWQVTAVDFSRVGLQKARERAGAAGVQMRYTEANLYEYAPPEAAFDLVLIVYMHPQVARRAAVFARAAAAVAPGGHLLVIGLDASDQGRSGGPPAERRYRVEDLCGAFPGIEAGRCEQVPRERQTPDGVEQATDALFWGERTLERIASSMPRS